MQYLEQLRQVIGLRGYGQKNPLDEYKRESFDLFKNLLSKIKENLIIFLVNLQVAIENNSQNKSLGEEKIPRNKSCSCGSGKKYKNCCGALSKD